MHQPQELMDELRAVARMAGQAILTVYHGDIEVEQKADDSPLTQADIASHERIVDGLHGLTPDIPVLSEESFDKLSWEERRGWDRYWLVDPLDGTKEFIKRNGEFTVNIALIQDHDPVLGIVHVPVTGVEYYGSSDGAFKTEDGRTRRIEAPRETASPLRVVGSRSHRGGSLDAWLAQLGPHEMVAMGSSLKLCLVAEGAADIYPRLGPTSEWDTAAADAVVRAAGGRVLTLDGEPLRYNVEADILNPYFLVAGPDGRDWAAELRPFAET